LPLILEGMVVAQFVLFLALPARTEAGGRPTQ